MKIITLGPAGTYCHLAALRYAPQGAIYFAETLHSIYQGLEKGEADAAIIPLNNSSIGEIPQGKEMLEKQGYRMIDSLALQVRYHLVGTELGEKKGILAQPYAYRQCQKTLEDLYPLCPLIPTRSNGESALLWKEDLLALVPPLAAEIYELPVLKENIADQADNMTLFGVIKRISV